MKKMLFLLLFGSAFVANGQFAANGTENNIFLGFDNGTGSDINKKVNYFYLSGIVNSYRTSDLPDFFQQVTDLKTTRYSGKLRIKKQNESQSNLIIPANVECYNSATRQWFSLRENVVVCLGRGFNFDSCAQGPIVTAINVDSSNCSKKTRSYTPPSTWKEYVQKNKTVFGLAGLTTLLVGGVAVYYKWLRGK